MTFMAWGLVDNSKAGGDVPGAVSSSGPRDCSMRGVNQWLDQTAAVLAARRYVSLRDATSSA